MGVRGGESGSRPTWLEPQSALRDPGVVFNLLAVMFFAGPVLVLAWLAVSADSTANVAAVLGSVAAAVIGGIGLLLAGRRRFSLWSLHAAIGGGTLVVSTAIYFSGTPDSGFAFFYLWGFPFAFAFFTRRQTAFYMLLVGAGLGGALMLQGQITPLQVALRTTLVLSSLLIVGVLVRYLTESLRASDIRFERGFAAARFGMALIGVDGRWLRVNPALCGFLGRSADELVGTPVDSFLHPTAATPTADALAAQTSADPAAIHLEQPYEHANGSLVWLEITASLIRDPRGVPAYFYAQLDDVTERRTASEWRARQERQLAEAQRIAALGSWEWDIVNDRVTWSDELYRIVGRDPADRDLRLGSYFGLLHPADRERAREAVDRSLTGQQPFDIEHRVVRPDGNVRVIHSIGKLVTDGAGRAVRMLGTAQDVTDAHAAAEAVRRADKRFRDLLDAAPDAIVLVDDRGRIVTANAQTARLTGYTAEELAGQYSVVLAPDYLHDEYIRRHRFFFEQRTLVPAEREFVIQRKDGSQFPCEVAFSTLETDNGFLAVAAIRDITDRKQAQAAEARLRARLHQSERLESVGLMAGGIAHDFNNLLSVILNYAALLESELAADSSARDELAEIRRAAERGAELTHELLVFSQRDVSEVRPLDLNSVLAQTERLLQRTIGEHVRLQTRCADDLWPVVADAGQMQQVLVNLVVNARDAMPEGGVITIETANREVTGEGSANGPVVPGRYVSLTVADTGVGMTDEVAARAFDPFFTTKPAGQGTGLGLASVYGVVTQAGGHVELVSGRAGGTAVLVYLPAADQAEVSETSSRRPSLEGRGETILLVEDEESVRESTRRILLRNGYTVVPARAAEEALRACASRERPIDLLLTDVVMPDMPGTELAERALATRPGLRVLYMSGYSAKTTIAPGDGEYGFVPKPFTPEQLLGSVQELLRQP